ncbi:MAG: hypothetical protein ACRD0F_06175, partial [Acidimicrobiales bacterium]
MAGPHPLAVVSRPDALAWADAFRRRRAEVLGLVGAGGIDLDGILALADADPLVAATKAVVLVEALPGVGKVRA